MSLSKLLVQSLVARARRRRAGVPREGDSSCTVGLVGAIGKLVYRHTRFGTIFRIACWCEAQDVAAMVILR